MKESVKVGRVDFTSTVSASNPAKNFAHTQAKLVEGAVVEQMSEFVKRGLIVIEISETTLVQDEKGLELRQAVKLKLKDQEYVEKLEKENAHLKLRLETIQKALA